MHEKRRLCLWRSAPYLLMSFLAYHAIVFTLWPNVTAALPAWDRRRMNKSEKVNSNSPEETQPGQSSSIIPHWCCPLSQGEAVWGTLLSSHDRMWPPTAEVPHCHGWEGAQRHYHKGQAKRAASLLLSACLCVENDKPDCFFCDVYICLHPTETYPEATLISCKAVNRYQPGTTFGHYWPGLY